MQFREFANQVIALYTAQSYAEALSLIDREGSRFPEAANQLVLWRACLHSLAGRTEAALQQLRGGLDTGHWWNERLLLDDKDFAPLHGHPAFDEVLLVCREHYAKARETARPELEEHHPTAGPAPLLVVQHGNGGNNWLDRPYWTPAVAAGWHVALAQSSQPWSQGGFVWDDREKATAEVQQHIARLGANPAVDTSRTVLGGFSRGAGTAMWLALTGAVPARGFVVMGPVFPQMVEELSPWIAPAAERGVRGYILIGEQEPYSLPAVKETAALFRAHGLGCELEVRPGLAHDYPQDFAEVLPRALAYVIGA